MAEGFGGADWEQGPVRKCGLVGPNSDIRVPEGRQGPGGDEREGALRGFVSSYQEEQLLGSGKNRLGLSLDSSMDGGNFEPQGHFASCRGLFCGGTWKRGWERFGS